MKTRHLKRLVTHNPTRRAAIQALAKRVSTLAPSMNARGVSTCFWCFGVLQWEDSVLFDALAKRVVNIKQHLDVQVCECLSVCVVCLWVYVYGCHSNVHNIITSSSSPYMITTIHNHHHHHTLFQALCNIAWSCGYGRYHNRSLLLCLAEQGLMLLQRCVCF